MRSATLGNAVQFWTKPVGVEQEFVREAYSLDAAAGAAEGGRTMKGIPMKTWEVQAILDDRKTVTRRLVKPKPEPFGKAYIYKGAICTQKAIAEYGKYRPGADFPASDKRAGGAVT